ncbi:MAG: hypothetical protein CMJ32_04065 [Phycisphaerae bacterium]|nr:hypothetical protein [Phycisphaerae bacterium]
MRTIAIVNQKGGCGKTTCAINLGAILASRGHSTLLVDMDPQSHCAAGLGVPEDRIERSIVDLLRWDRDVPPSMDDFAWEVGRNLRLVPSTVSLAGIEAAAGGIATRSDRDLRLKRVLDWFSGSFEFCLVDCPPTIGLLTFNALRASNEALVPVETGYFALKGAQKQYTTIQGIIRRFGHDLPIHVLPTLMDTKSQLASDIHEALGKRFPDSLLPVAIREHEVIREATSYGQPVLEYAPESGAMSDFNGLADWLLSNEPVARRIEPDELDGADEHVRVVSEVALEPLVEVDENSRAAELARRITTGGNAP